MYNNENILDICFFCVVDVENNFWKLVLIIPNLYYK